MWSVTRKHWRNGIELKKSLVVNHTRMFPLTSTVNFSSSIFILFLFSSSFRSGNAYCLHATHIYRLTTENIFHIELTVENGVVRCRIMRFSFISNTLKNLSSIGLKRLLAGRIRQENAYFKTNQSFQASRIKFQKAYLSWYFFLGMIHNKYWTYNNWNKKKKSTEKRNSV